MKITEGGVTAAKGFTANGIHCGIRKNKTKRDLSLIFSSVPANAASVYTTNLVKGAPLTVTKKHLEDGKAQAVICNSGNANTCNANGIEIAEKMSELTAAALGIQPEDVIVASTGVIGQPLSLEPIAAGMEALAAGLGAHSGLAAEGIMTTDTKKKEIAVSFDIGGVECKIGGIAKGSGMIHPNMATMLVFITTDCAISTQMLKKALSTDIQSTFNMVSVLECCGGSAIGLSGIDGHMIKAEVRDERLGYVGKVTKIDPKPVLDVLEKGYIPVISTLGCDDEGNVYNINADTAAAKIAAALGAEGLITLTDIAGILQDKDDPSTLISHIGVKDTERLIKEGVIVGGMIPKVECCAQAVRDGVRRVFIIDGRIPHSILIETLTDEGIGTMFDGGEDD